MQDKEAGNEEHNGIESPEDIDEQFYGSRYSGNNRSDQDKESFSEGKVNFQPSVLKRFAVKCQQIEGKVENKRCCQKSVRKPGFNNAENDHAGLCMDIR